MFKNKSLIKRTENLQDFQRMFVCVWVWYWKNYSNFLIIFDCKIWIKKTGGFACSFFVRNFEHWVGKPYFVQEVVMTKYVCVCTLYVKNSKKIWTMLRTKLWLNNRKSFGCIHFTKFWAIGPKNCQKSFRTSMLYKLSCPYKCVCVCVISQKLVKIMNSTKAQIVVKEN